MRGETCYTDNMKNRVELYEKSAFVQERARKRRTLLLMLLIGAAGLAACIVLCTFGTRRNQKVLLPVTIGISIVTGWTVITILHGAFAASDARCKHSALMLNEPRETVHGRFEKTDSISRMKNGVAVRKVLCTEGDRETVLSVNASLAKDLPDAFIGTAETVYSFIVAYEVDEDVETHSA